MKRGNAAGTVATLALTCIFGVTLLMGIFAGAAVYQRVGDRVEKSAGERVGLTYLTAKVRGFDQRLPDGGIHCEGGLKSQFGNGALKAVIDLKPDGAFTGYVGLTKGLRLAIEGKRVA